MTQFLIKKIKSEDGYSYYETDIPTFNMINSKLYGLIFWQENNGKRIIKITNTFGYLLDRYCNNVQNY